MTTSAVVDFGDRLGSSNIENTVWGLDDKHHFCVAQEDVVTTCGSVVQTRCQAALEDDAGYTCPSSAAAGYNLDRFARACHLPTSTMTSATDETISLIDDNGVLESSLRAGFVCICEQCLGTSAYAGCKWVAGEITYAACTANLDCYAGNEKLNLFTTIFEKNTDCWTTWQWVITVISPLILLSILLAVYRRIWGGGGNGNVSTTVTVGAGFGRGERRVDF